MPKIGEDFQDSVWAFLKKHFGNASNYKRRFPDIEVVVNHVKLNLEVTIGKSGFGLVTKVSKYEKRGVPLHAIIVASPEVDTEYRGVRILGFDENLPKKLIEIAKNIKQYEAKIERLSFKNLRVYHTSA